jgi:hypothetical protein
MKCRWRSFVCWALSEPIGAVVALIAASILFGVLAGAEGYALVSRYAAPHRVLL